MDRDALMALDSHSHAVEIEQDLHIEQENDLDPAIIAQDVSIGDQDRSVNPV